MNSVILKGQKITIGSQVRFIDDSNLYTTIDVAKPEVGQVYIVRGFSPNGGFYLEEIKNEKWDWMIKGQLDVTAEPGFAVWRFEPAQPLMKKKIVQIKIEPIVEERLDIPLKVKSKELDLA